MSDKWKRIVAYAKVLFGVIMMVIGFWFGYAFIWFAAGLPQTAWALWVCFGLAFVSEYIYLAWITEGL